MNIRVVSVTSPPSAKLTQTKRLIDNVLCPRYDNYLRANPNKPGLPQTSLEKPKNTKWTNCLNSKEIARAGEMVSQLIAFTCFSRSPRFSTVSSIHIGTSQTPRTSISGDPVLSFPQAPACTWQTLTHTHTHKYKYILILEEELQSLWYPHPITKTETGQGRKITTFLIVCFLSNSCWMSFPFSSSLIITCSPLNGILNSGRAHLVSNVSRAHPKVTASSI